MRQEHRILQLPEQDEELNAIVSDDELQVTHISFTTSVVEGQVKHYVLIMWHKEQYGDHEF